MKQIHQHPLIREKLLLSGLRELANRNRTTGIFHFVTLSLSIYLSPLSESHSSICQLLFALLTVGVILRTALCFQKVQDKHVSNHWSLSFGTLTVMLFAVWSLWLCFNLYYLGLGPSSYFCCLILAGLCSGGIMSYAPSRLLMNFVIAIVHFPAILLLFHLGIRDKSHEAYVIGILFFTNLIYLFALAKNVNQHYKAAIINRELTVQNHQVVEGVLHSVPGMVSCVDHQLNYVWTNRKLDERFGINVNKKVKTLGSYGLNDQFPEFVRKFIASGKEVDQIEYQMMFPDGPCWMMVFLSSYQEYGEGRVLIVAYDIQSSKNAELELEKQRQMSMENAKLATLGEMSAGIAHEINNPLAVMMGRADMMISELKKGSVAPEILLINLEKIVKGSERIAKIIKGLKTFARNGDQDEFQMASVENLVQDVLDFSREKFKHKSIELKCDVDPELAINCRSTQIEQVLLNLLSNSFDAIVDTPEPWILVEGKFDGNDALIMVTDSGNGIDPLVIAKIMQPFYTTKEVGKGTGLGLSISLGIIKSHHGDFYCDTSCKNTKFVIRIPRHQQKIAA